MRALLIAAWLLAGCVASQDPAAEELPATPETIAFDLVVRAAACAEPAGGCSRLVGGGSFDAFYATGARSPAPLLFEAEWDGSRPFADELIFRIWFVDDAAPPVEFSSGSSAMRSFEAPVGKDFAFSVRPAADPAATFELVVAAKLTGPVAGPKPLG